MPTSWNETPENLKRSKLHHLENGIMRSCERACQRHVGGTSHVSSDITEVQGRELAMLGSTVDTCSCVTPRRLSEDLRIFPRESDFGS